MHKNKTTPPPNTPPQKKTPIYQQDRWTLASGFLVRSSATKGNINYYKRWLSLEKGLVIRKKNGNFIRIQEKSLRKMEISVHSLTDF